MHFARGKWHKPRTSPIVGPFGCCVIITDDAGVRIVIPGAPVVEVTQFQFAELVRAIIESIGDQYFTAEMLRHHAEVIGGPLRAAIGNKSNVQLGKALKDIADGNDYWGYRVERITLERNKTLWQVRLIG
jgi:hypothetical protein